MATKSPSRDAALAILNGAASGHYARDVAAAIDLSPGRCAKLLQNMRQEGLIGSVAEGEKGNPARKRYFALQHKNTALAANQAGKGWDWGRGRARQQGYQAGPEVAQKGVTAEPSPAAESAPLRIDASQARPWAVAVADQIGRTA